SGGGRARPGSRTPRPRAAAQRPPRWWHPSRQSGYATAGRRYGRGMARSALAVALAALALAPTGADAAAPKPWATVNVCDTAKHPNTIGVRASMPGAERKRVRMYMRFRVQWRDRTDGRWHNLLEGRGGDSGWVSLGRSRKG